MHPIQMCNKIVQNSFIKYLGSLVLFVAQNRLSLNFYNSLYTQHSFDILYILDDDISLLKHNFIQATTMYRSYMLHNHVLLC